MSKDTRPWIKVSVDMWRHPKITALTMNQRWALIGLWSLAMEYTTDGIVTLEAARAAGIRSHVIRGIVEAGLATYLDSNDRPFVDHSSTIRPPMVDQSSTNQRPMSVQLHDYLSHQLSKAELERRTDQRRSAGRKGGKAKAAKRSGPLQPDGSGPLSDTRGHARAADIEREEEHLPPNAAAASYVTREQPQPQQPSTHFSDGTAIPPEPPSNDPPVTRGALALVHDADAIPNEISADPRRTPLAIGDTARTLVRYATPDGIPRQIRDDLAEQVQRLANDRNVDRSDIEAGLREWSNRPGAGPRLLPHLVADAARARTARPTGPKSTTDERIAAIQSLKHQPATDHHRSLE